MYWAGRATLVRRPEDLAVYDRSFEAFWLGRPLIEAQPPASPPDGGAMVAAPDPHAGQPPGPDDGEEVREEQATMALRYSATEVLRAKDFAAYSRAEFAEAHRLMADLRLAGALKRSRRWRPSGTAAARRRPDLRRTVRAALGSGGEPMRRHWLAPSERPRRVVLLCDVSGSMEPYARALLRFAHAAVVARGAGRVEVFAVGTRLTRLTRELTWRDPDVALAQATRSVTDWSGGTRLGEGLRAFNDRFGVRGMARGAVVVILSDGWDRGDPDALAAEMGRLHRVAHQVVWVNPLLAGPGYAPVAQGMAAALPHVDRFVPGHSLRALEDLVDVIAGVALRRASPT